ncbi:MAG: NACHT domain-containing protein [Ancrocorticia sp.]
MPILNRYSALRVLEGLPLDERVRRDVLRILDQSGDDGRIRVSDVIKELFPYVKTASANNGIAKIVREINDAADEAGIPVRFEKTANKKAGAKDRWLWFEGPEPAPELSRTAEIDSIPAGKRIADQRGIDPEGLTRVLLLTFNEHETRAVLRQFCGDSSIPTVTVKGVNYRDLGVHGGAQIFHRVSRQGISEAQLSTSEGIEGLSPRAVIGVGIAFGVDEAKQRIGDVLVSTAVKDYELKKVKSRGVVEPRGLTPPASRKLVDQFNHLSQSGRGDGSDGWPRISLGVLLSGNSLVDDMDYRDSLVELSGTDIVGGEMEGIGIHKQAEAKDVHWIIVKAICDWGDGNKSNPRKEDDQKLAAANAALVVWKALQNPIYPVTGMEPEPDPCVPSLWALDNVGNRFQANRGRATILHKDVTDRPQREEGEEVLAALHAWVRRSDGPPVFALLGEYGMGKSVTCQRFARELRDARDNDPSAPLSLYFDLRDLTGLDNGVPSLDRIVEEIMNRSWPRNGGEYTASDFRRWIQEDTVVIFDGLDEVLVKLTEGDGQIFTRTLLSIIAPNAAKSPKVVISCRTQYFRTLRDQQNHFTGQERGDARAEIFQAMVLLPFSEDQVRRYLAAALPDQDPDRLLEMIRSIHNLGELTERPYTLSLVTQYIPDLERDRIAGRSVYGVTLYRRTVENWLDRDEGKHQIRRSDKLPLAAHLAAHLWRHRKPALPARDIENWFQTWLDSEPGLRSRYSGIHPDRLEEDLRTATFLARTDEAKGSTFRFCHTSMQEFFLAMYLMEAITVDAPELWALPRPSQETFDFLGQLLAEANDLELLQTLSTWRLQYREQTSENLFMYALRAYEHGWPQPNLRGVQLQNASLNDLAIRAPKTSRRPLDLSNAEFTGATMQRVAMDSVVLDDADFTDAVLNQAYFRECSSQLTRWDRCSALGAVWRRTKLAGAIFADSELRGAVFQLCEGVPQSIGEARRVPSSELVVSEAENRLVWIGDTVTFSMVFSPDGQYLATAGNGVRVWNAMTGELVMELDEMRYTRSVAYSPGGQYLATAGNGVRVWNAMTGELVMELDKAKYVNSLVYSPDGQYLTVAGYGVRVWNAMTGELMKSFEDTMFISSVASSPDGQYLVTASDGVHVWDAMTGELVMELDEVKYVNSLVYSPDGLHLATAGDGACVWDAMTGKLIVTLDHQSSRIDSVVYSPDGLHLATAGDSARVWDAMTGEFAMELDKKMRASLVVYSPDGQYLVTARDGVHVWDAMTGELVMALDDETVNVPSAVYSPDGLYVAVVGDAVRVWDATTGKLMVVLDHQSGHIRSVVYSPDGQHLVTTGNGVRVWDAMTGELVMALDCEAMQGLSVAYSPDGRYLATAGDGVRVWDAMTGELVMVLDDEAVQWISVVYSPDGLYVAVAGDGVRVWDAMTGKLVMVLDEMRYTSSLMYSPDGLYVAVAGDGVRVWDAMTGKLVMVLDEMRYTSSVAYSPDGRYLATAGDGVRVWDATSGELVKFLHKTIFARSVAYSPNSRYLTMPNGDGTVRIWDCVTWENTLAIGLVSAGRLGIGGHAVWSPPSNKLVHAEADAWRLLRWQTSLPGSYPPIHHLEEFAESAR